jgi:hypothetical protein
MRPRTKPPSVKDWADWPTLDTLRINHPSIKLHALRALLRDVRCYKGDDNTVRYRPDEAEAALRGETDAADDDEANDEANDDRDRSFVETIEGLPAPALVLVLREFRKLFTDNSAATQSTLRAIGETVKLMAEPLKLGIELTKQNADRTQSELSTHREQHDRMVKTTDELLTHQVERELKQQSSEQTLKFRTDAMDFAKEHGAKVLDKWTLTQQGTAALKFLRGLDPTLIDIARQQGYVSDEQLEQLKKVRGDVAPDSDDMQ